MTFRTKLDFSSNRQVKQYEATITNLSGGTSFGLTFSALTTGPDLTTTGVSETYLSIASTFSGNTGTTNYTWYDSRMSLGESALSALTPSNSATTQHTGQIYTPSSTTVIDGNTVNLAYTGVTFDIYDIIMADLGGGDYSGTVQTNSFKVLSAETLAYTGRTIWADVSGITRTERLIITNNPQVGYVWTCADTEGMGAWGVASSGSTFTGNTSGSCITNIWVRNIYGCTPITIDNSIQSVGSSALTSTLNFVYGNSNSILTTADYSFIGGGSGNSIDGSSDTAYSSFIGGGINSRILKADNAAMIGGDGNFIDSGDNSVTVGGSGNTINAINSVIIGGSGITGLTPNMVYVPDLIIDGLTGVTNLQTDANGQIIDEASDITLKDNIKTLSGSLNKILQLNPVSFEWKPEMNLRQGTVYGLIAQEVNNVIPEIVRERGKGNGTLTLEYKELIPWLIGAVQELSSGVTTTTNTYLETQTILAEDNNIELNYGGTKETALGGGLRVINSISSGLNSELLTDVNGDWVTNTDFKSKALTIPLYTPTSSNDKTGNEGNITRDNNYLYIKTISGWKRANLEIF